MKCLVIMMQKNEGELLKTWYLYHRSLFSSSSICVVDNGSEDSLTLKILQDIEGDGARVLYRADRWSFENKGVLFIEIERTLYADFGHEFFFPLDADEFVVLKQESGVGFSPFEYLQSLPREHDLFQIAGSYTNRPGSKCSFSFWDEKKVFFRGGAAEWMDMGFHSGRSSAHSEPLITDVAHLHFQMKPYDLLRRHALAKLEGRVDTSNMEALSEYKGAGYHLVRFILGNEEDYLKEMQYRKWEDIGEVEDRFADLGLSVPFA